MVLLYTNCHCVQLSKCFDTVCIVSLVGMITLIRLLVESHVLDML